MSGRVYRRSTAGRQERSPSAFRDRPRRSRAASSAEGVVPSARQRSCKFLGAVWIAETRLPCKVSLLFWGMFRWSQCCYGGPRRRIACRKRFLGSFLDAIAFQAWQRIGHSLRIEFQLIRTRASIWLIHDILGCFLRVNPREQARVQSAGHFACNGLSFLGFYSAVAALTASPAVPTGLLATR